MNYFSSIFGLVSKEDPQSENGGLQLGFFYTLKRMLGERITITEADLFVTKMRNAKVTEGLYLRSSYHKFTRVSQDEQSGFSICSYILETNHRFEIWKYLDKHHNYPATGEDRRYNPGDYYAWGTLAGAKPPWYSPFWYCINLVLSSNKPKGNTSSKLIYLCELYLMKDISKYANKLWKYYSWRMKFMYGKNWINALFETCYIREDSDFPLKELSRRLNR